MADPMADTARVALIGATASGKSSLALAFAKRHVDVEIVSVDSMQVYRGMDIGTASPSPEERAAVPHHLIDVCEPSEEFTVGRFRDLLNESLLDIGRHGNRALLVGGTGLYHRCAVDGLELAGGDDVVRARLEDEARELGVEALHERLTSVDPVAAGRMESTNLRRVVRALEVIEVTGRAFSSFGDGLDRYPPTPVPQIGLRWERAVLAERIEARVHTMIDAGFVDEVAAIVSSSPSRTALQALGYAEIAAHLRGECSLDEAIDATILHTRQFAVRQERWFRRDPRIRWVDITADPVLEAMDALEEIWDHTGGTDHT
ncbi:MAG: tRNA (adenosine(37)-N6)-dimethylallyltransferase MiaA [Ilumatobacteraceae bacterium]